jgi:hypothetical protein
LSGSFDPDEEKIKKKMSSLAVFAAIDPIMESVNIAIGNYIELHYSEK